MTTILGIGHAIHDSGAALICDGDPVVAVNESRLSRVKREARFPASAVNYILQSTDESVDRIAVAGATNRPLTTGILTEAKYGGYATQRGERILRAIYRGLREPDEFVQRTATRLVEQTDIDISVETLQKRIEYVDHHRAHAASAYYTSGFDEATILTVDGSGDGLSSTIFAGRDGTLERVRVNADVDSIGYLWAEIPTLFGFKGSKHAGKFMGMAAYVDEVPRDVERELASMVTIDGLDVVNRFERNHYPDDFETTVMALKKRLSEFEPPVVARALQQRTEEVIGKLAANAIEETGLPDVALAGGVFANVKLNQRIYELSESRGIFIHPNMGDGGLGIGAALDVWARDHPNPRPSRLPNVYLGPSYDEDEVAAAIDRFKLSPEYKHRSYDDVDELAESVAEVLADGGVVSHYHGQLEYGPRALGNRSILYQPTEPDAIEWLNRWLNRTEFMPFAPVTLKTHAEECYHGYDPETCPAADFMTITFKCTEQMQQRSPGVVHVDGTARPQLVDEETNPQYHRILKKYHEKTGIPTLINTSFNMHGEPIVCTPAEALESFFRTGNEALVLERTLIRRVAE